MSDLLMSVFLRVCASLIGGAQEKGRNATETDNAGVGTNQQLYPRN
jgi:hypothetical protein